MENHDYADEKRIAVEHLDFGGKTAKRVGWEAFEFSVDGPHQVRVTNAAYGFLKEEHSYTVGVAVVDGQALPAECNCPADVHREPDCKHKVALATVGGPTVLNAAVGLESPTANETDSPETMADSLRTDGGCECDKGDFPCFECYLSDRRELPK